MKKFDKKFLSISDQVKLLKSRGLIIDNEKRLSFYLKHINYYHLSAYFKAFQDKDNNFIGNTNFEDVLNIYEFDKKLRLLFLDSLEKIEMSIKSALAYELTNKRDDIYWYLPNRYIYKKNIDKIKEIIIKSKGSRETCVSHFFKNYQEENLPAWFFFESLSFGACVTVMKALDNTEKQFLSNFYGLSRKSIQTLHQLSILRNSCAHHSWVWNKRFTLKVSKSKEYSNLFDNVNTDSLYALVIYIQIFLVKISPNSNLLEKLEKLVKDYSIKVNRMGFPLNWKKELESISN